MLRQCLINAIWTGLMSTASPRAWIASSMTTTPTLLVENFIITLLMHKTWQKRNSIFRQGRDLDWWRRLPPRYFPQMTSAKLWYTCDYISWPPTSPTSDFVYTWQYRHQLTLKLGRAVWDERHHARYCLAQELPRHHHQRRQPHQEEQRRQGVQFNEHLEFQCKAGTSSGTGGGKGSGTTSETTSVPGQCKLKHVSKLQT